jgi:hypothetical protein
MNGSAIPAPSTRSTLHRIRALLVAIALSRVAPLLRAWRREGIAGHVIGRAERGRGVVALRDGRPVPFPWVAQDEIVKALS